MLNLYLDHFLDRKWRKLHPTTPLIRYADDLLVPCQSRKEAITAHATLVGLLQPAGMTLKEGLDRAVHRLDRGEEAAYMGFQIGRGQGRLRLGLTGAAWEGLDESLEAAHQAPASPLRAAQTVHGWLSQRAPCFSDVGVEALYARVQKVARRHAFDELLYPGDVTELAEKAVRRWEEARRAARHEGEAARVARKGGSAVARGCRS